MIYSLKPVRPVFLAINAIETQHWFELYCYLNLTIKVTTMKISTYTLAINTLGILIYAICSVWFWVGISA